MDKIIKFYELNEEDLINYRVDTIDKLYSLIREIKQMKTNKNWLEKSLSVISECDEFFSIINPNYVDYLDKYIDNLSNCLINYTFEKNTDEMCEKTVRKINLYIQLLEYLHMINYQENIFFDANKYYVTISAYNIFFNLKNEIEKCCIEWNSNNFILYYSQSINYTNICIYHLDDSFGYKIVLSFKKNNISEKIKLCVFDLIIKSEKDFYSKIERKNKINGYAKHFINTKQIAKCFSSNSSSVTIEYLESNFIDENKMLQYVNIFLND
jgi:hypothetical protein